MSIVFPLQGFDPLLNQNLLIPWDLVCISRATRWDRRDEISQFFKFLNKNLRTYFWIVALSENATKRIDFQANTPPQTSMQSGTLHIVSQKDSYNRKQHLINIRFHKKISLWKMENNKDLMCKVFFLYCKEVLRIEYAFLDSFYVFTCKLN